MLKVKKTLSLCLALILMISLAVPLAHAEEEYNPPPVSYSDTVFSVDSTSVNEGQTVELTVSVRNNHGLCGYNISLTFENPAFTVSRVTRGNFANKGSVTTNSDDFNAGSTNTLTVNYYNTSGGFENDGTLCVISLATKGGKTAGTYPISLSYNPNSTLKWDDIAASTEGKGHFPIVNDIQCAGGEVVVNHVWNAGEKVPSLTIPDPAVQDTLYTCVVCGETRRELGFDPHHWEVTENVAPKCTEDGHISYKCTDCTLTRTEIVPATGHTWGAWTSIDENTHSHTCSVCNTVESGTHEYGTAIVPPTCTEAGRTVHTCRLCSRSYSEIGDPPTGHHYEPSVVAASCTSAGYTLFVCPDCGSQYAEAGAPATGHDFGNWTKIVTPSHDAEGNFVLVTDPVNHQRKCKNCDERELAPHTYTSTEVAPTCTEAGYVQYNCKDCPYYYRVETDPAIGHDYVATVTEPTCTQAGYTTYTCTKCGSSYRVTGEPATGHTFGPWTSLSPQRHQRRCTVCNFLQTGTHNLEITEVPVQCMVNGSRTSYCPDCGFTETREILAWGHKYEDVVTPPTCTEDGYKTRTCTVCGHVRIDKGDPATGHDFGEWEVNEENHVRRCSKCDAVESAAHDYESVTTPPTCTEAGVITQTCKVCGHTKTSAGDPALGHDYKAEETAPTCTQAGTIKYTCSRCGNSYTEAGAPALGHDFGPWVSMDANNHKHDCSRCNYTESAPHKLTVSETAATCTAPGSKVSTCSDCGYTNTETIPALGHNYVAAETPPTCTEAGTITYTCSRCGDSYTNPGAPATGHTWGEWKDNGENHIRTCSKCNATETAAHTFTVTETAPTCTAEGSKVSTCSVCGHKDTEAIPALGHDYQAVVTAPTCTAAGYTTYTCSRCGNSYTEAGAPATGHTFGQWTSVNNEAHTRKCANCDVTETANHNFTVVEVPATPDTDGSRTSTCSDCGYVKTEKIPATGHNYVGVETPPTCTQDGYITYTCTDCGNSYTNPGAPALGHAFGDWADNGENHIRTCSRCNATETAAHTFSVTETAPTCSIEGKKVSTCAVCGHTDTEVIPALGHDYVSVVTAPTCTAAGYTTYTCSRCGSSYTEAGAPALGHVFGSWTDAGANHSRTCSRCNETETAAHSFTVEETAATCTEAGKKVSTCSVCGHTDTETLPALGHNYVAVETAPTCTEAGYTTYTCSRCGDSYTQAGAPATGHSFEAWESINNAEHSHKCSKCGITETAEHDFTVTEVPATPDASGSRTYTCKVCGYVKTETIPPLGHNYVGVETPPTCTEDGYITYTCTDCGDSYRNPGAPALGHNWGAWTDAGENQIRTCSRCGETETSAHSYTETVTEPTCTEDGKKVYVCSDCGKTVTEIIPAVGHNYTETVVAPTATEGGYTLHTCSVCGESYKDNFTDPLGPTGLKGDVDLDGDVDNADLIQIARHVVHIITLTDRKFWAGDMNDDGAIDNQDIIIHARKLVGL